MQHALEDLAATIRVKLGNPGKGGSWCRAEVQALMLLHAAIQAALTDGRVLQHIHTVPGQKVLDNP